jgi:hypothetical protein
MTADDDMTRENTNDGLLSQLGALRNRLAAADPGFEATSRRTGTLWASARRNWPNGSNWANLQFPRSRAVVAT